MFTPYEGEEPYIFASYAHADSPAVMAVLNDMHDKGYRIWYDEGIEVGSEWPECIAEHLTKAHLVIAFISNGYMASANCRREMHFALSKRIKTINVFLESTQMTPGMEMQIGNIFALMKYCMSDELFFKKLYSAPLLNSESFSAVTASAAVIPAAKAAEPPKEPERKVKAEVKPKVRKKKERAPKSKVKRILRLCAVLLVIGVLIAGGIVGHFTGLTQRLIVFTQLAQVSPEPGSAVAKFTEATFEAIAREYTGVDSGDITVESLYGVTEIYIYGDSFYLDKPEGEVSSKGGSVKELADLKWFTKLSTLRISCDSLKSLETLPACSIKYLDISNCPVTTLQGIGKLPELREVTADGCPVGELGDIDHCPQLLHLSLKDCHVTDYSAVMPLTKLTDVSVSNCTLKELKPILSRGSLTRAAFSDCDLRGSFFHSFDRERGIAYISLENCELTVANNMDEFESLTELRVINSGAGIDWSTLARLPLLSRVCADRESYPALERALKNTGVAVELIEG